MPFSTIRAHADETTPYPPKHAGFYGQTKAEAERLVKAAGSDALRVVIARPRFIWGNDDSTLLPAFKMAVEWVSAFDRHRRAEGR